MATTNEETFSSLDPLGPEYGNINQPTLDNQGLSAFEGERIRDKQINFPTAPSFTPIAPGLGNLESPNHNVRKNIVGTAPNKPGVNNKTSHQDIVNGINAKLRAQIQTNQDKNAYAKIYSYDAGPDANAFYKRYQAYGQETFDKIGFSPLRDNEALFNSRTTMWDDHARMMKHSFWPLFAQGFTAGPKSLMKMASGDFTSSDLEESKAYEEAAAIGQSNKGGVGGFTNNLLMNFAYSAGIMTEAIVEEAAGILLAPETLGASFFLTSANNLRKAPLLFKGIKMFDKASDGLKAINTTLKSVDNFSGAKKFWEGTKALSSSSLNPLKNTFQGLKDAQATVKFTDQVYNFTNLGKAYKTAGGFYKDVRNINMALSEARLEAGTVENKIYDNLYNEYYKKHNTAPGDQEQYEMIKQAKKGALNTLYWNTALIYGSNTITFPNIVGPKGGLNNFMKNTVKELQTVEGGKFGKLGSIVYDKAKKEFAFQANDFKTYVKNWAKQPVYKSLKSTLGYTKANFTEGAQESLQEIISGANEKYYTDSFKSPVVQSHNYAKGISAYNSMTQGDYVMAEAKKQMSAQGLETFASGFFMGTLASPINKSFEFLSVGYNRMFKPEVYQQYKTEKEKIANETVKQLNNIDIKDFFDSRIFNYGVQDAVGSIKSTGTTKEAYDADHDGFMSQMDMLMRTGTIDVFRDKLKEMQQMSPEEFEENVPSIPKGEGEKYQARIDDTLNKIDRIEKRREYYNQKFPNPVDIENVTANNAAQYEDDIALHYAWNDAIKHAVYFNETFEDTMQRKKAIVSKYLSKAPLKGMSQIDSEVLFDDDKLDNEILMLRDEVESLKGLDDPQSKKQLKEKSKKLEAYEILSDATYNFKTYFNRYDNAEQIKNELQKQKGNEPVTDEELEKTLDEIYGEFSEENIGLYYANYANGYKKYLKMISNDDDMLFDQDIQESFTLLADHHKLDKESRRLMDYVNLLHDPNGFIEQVERTKEWMKDLYRRREDYYREMVNRELDKVEGNALLNELADKGIYVSADDYANYNNNGVPPSEFFDNVNKMVYKRGTQKYNEIYRELLEKKDNLKTTKAKPKTTTLKNKYNEAIDALNKKEKEELDALGKSKIRSDVKTFETNNINTTDAEFIKSQLEPEQYVELKYPENSDLNKIFFLDKDGVLKYDDVNGIPVDESDIDFAQSGAYEASVFTYTEDVDPELKKEIQERYQALRDDILKDYNKDVTYEKETNFVPIPTDVTGKQLKEYENFYEKQIRVLFNAYVNNLYPDPNDRLGVFEEEENELLTEFIKTPEIQEIIKAYNIKNSPVEDKEDYTLDFKGIKTDTSKLSIDDIKALINKIELEIENLKSETNTDFSKNILELETELTNLRGVIKARAQKKFTPEQKAAIENVKKLQALNKKVVEAGVELSEDDLVTGLKKGDIAYRINGEFHRRVSNVIDKLKSKQYSYNSEEDVREAYAETIEVQGLTNDSVDAFINKLIEKDISGSDGLFFEKLRSRLRSMVVIPVDEQIKTLQKQIAELDTKIADARIKDETVKEEQYVIEKEKLSEKIIALQMQQPVSMAVEAKKADIILPIGTSGSGKSTWIKSVNKNNEFVVISPDEMRIEFTGDINDKSKDDEIYEAVKERAINAVKEGKRVIIDSTNLRKDRRRPFINAVKEALPTANIKYKLMPLNPELAKQRIKADIAAGVERADVSDATIDRHAATYKEMLQDIKSEDISDYDAELAALGGTSSATETAKDLNKEEKNLSDVILDLIAENTYQDGRTAGNYIDNAAKDFFNLGKQPDFVEGAITREAYDSLFGPDGYLTKLKEQADNGDIFIASEGLVVWDSDITLPDGTKDRVAGEIDLIIVDKDGTTRIVDIKTSEERTWNIFNATQTSPEKEVYSKREAFTLQQGAYSRLYENMFGVTPTIHILPIQRKSNKSTEQVIEAGKPTNVALFNNIQYEIDPETGNFVLDAFGNPKFTILDKGVNPNKFIPLYIEIVQDRINSVIPLKAVATVTEDVVETPETNEEETSTESNKPDFVNDNQNDPYTVGTMVFDTDGNSYQITKRFKNGNINIVDSNKKSIKVTMKELKENYKLESEVYNTTSPVETYVPTPEEEENLKISEDNVDILLDDAAATDALIDDAENISSSKAEDDLLDDLNCK